MLETRVVPAFTFSFAGGIATATQTAGTSDASLVFAQSGAMGIEYSLDGAGFVNTWGGMGPVANIAANQVRIVEASGANNGTITLGTPSAPVSPFSSFNVNFVVSQTGALGSSSLAIDDSTGTLAGTYSYTGTTFVAPSNINLSNTATQSGGVTIKGSPFSDTYNALGSKTGEPVNFVGNSGTNIVNVGSTPATPATSKLNNIHSAVNFSDTQTGGTATVNINDAGSTTSAAGTLSFTSPNETVSGLGFGTGGSFAFNAATPGVTTLNVSQGTNGAAGVTTNVVSTPAALSTTITGGTNTNTFNIGGATPGSLSNVSGAVTVHGGAATSIINLNDQSTVASETYTITGTTVTRTGTFGGLTYSGLGVLHLNTGTGTNLVNVTSTLNGITTSVGAAGMINVNGTGTGGSLNVATGAAGGSTVNVVADSQPVNVTTNGTPTADTVNIGAAGGTGNLPGITGLVTVTGNQPYALAINDQGDASAQTYIVNIGNGNSGAVLLGATQFLSFEPSSVNGLTFNGSNNGNVINFNISTPPNSITQINAGAGNDTTILRGSGMGSTVNIDSQAGPNTVVLGGNTVSPFPQGAQWLLGTAVNVADTGGTTALTIDDSPDISGRTATITGTSVTGLAPATINFTAPAAAGGNGVNSLTVNGGSGGNTFTVNGTLANSVSPFETLNSGTAPTS